MLYIVGILKLRSRIQSRLHIANTNEVTPNHYVANALYGSDSLRYIQFLNTEIAQKIFS